MTDEPCSPSQVMNTDFWFSSSNRKPRSRIISSSNQRLLTRNNSPSVDHGSRGHFSKTLNRRVITACPKLPMISEGRSFFLLRGFDYERPAFYVDSAFNCRELLPW